MVPLNDSTFYSFADYARVTFTSNPPATLRQYNGAREPGELVRWGHDFRDCLSD